MLHQSAIMLQLLSGKVNDMDYETLHPGIAAGFALSQVAERDFQGAI